MWPYKVHTKDQQTGSKTYGQDTKKEHRGLTDYSLL